MGLRYSNTFYGVSVDRDVHTPQYSSGDGSTDSGPSATVNANYGAVEEIILKADPLALVGLEGSSLMVGYGKVERLVANFTDPETGTAAFTYSYGPLSLGVQKTGVSYGNFGTAKATGVSWAKNTTIGAAFAVNDQLSDFLPRNRLIQI